MPTYTDKYGNMKIGKRGRGRPPKRMIEQVVKKDIRKEIKKLRGRPASQTTSLKVISGSLRVKSSKSRVIRIGNKRVAI